MKRKRIGAAFLAACMIFVTAFSSKADGNEINQVMEEESSGFPDETYIQESMEDFEEESTACEETGEETEGAESDIAEAERSTEEQTELSLTIENVTIGNKIADEVIAYGDSVFYARTDNLNAGAPVCFDVVLSSEHAEVISAKDSYNMEEYFRASNLQGEYDFSVQKNELSGENRYTISRPAITRIAAGSKTNYWDAYVCWFTVEEENNGITSVRQCALVMDTTPASGTSTRISEIQLFNDTDGNALYDTDGSTYDLTPCFQGTHVRAFSLPSSISQIAVKISGDDISKTSTAMGIHSWLTADENYVSINGSEPKQVPLSTLEQGEYFSPGMNLRNGTNVVEIMVKSRGAFLSEKAYSNLNQMPWRLRQPIDEGMNAVLNYQMPSSPDNYYFSYVYIIHWDGEEAQDTLSGNAGLRYLGANNLRQTALTEGQIMEYTCQLADGTKENPHILSLPVLDGNTESTKIVLGVTTEDTAAVWELEDASLQRGCRIGRYVVVETKELPDESMFIIKVTAEDNTVKNHYVKIIRKSSECDLVNLSVENGILRETVEADTCIYHIDINDSDSIHIFPEVSEGAVVTANGKTLNAEEGITVDKADYSDRILLCVIAADGITGRNYYITFEKNGENLFFKQSEKTKQTALEMLDGWYNRPVNIQKNIASEGYWGVFKACATNMDLNGAYVYDITTHSFNQATDWAACILELVMLGENPYDFRGVNYVDGLLAEQNKYGAGQYGPWGNNIWALMALKAVGEEIPSNLLTTVINQAKSPTFDLDMRGWALAAAADYLSEQEKLEILGSFAQRQVREGEYTYDEGETGMFKHYKYHRVNSMTHGCILSGIAGTGIDAVNMYTLSYRGLDNMVKITDPLTALKNFSPDGKRYFYLLGEPESAAGYNKDVIIGLGDTYYGSNVWNRYTLTRDMFDELVLKAEHMLDENPAEELRITLERKLADARNAALAAGDGVIAGLGDEYYGLLQAMEAIDTSLKPEVTYGYPVIPRKNTDYTVVPDKQSDGWYTEGMVIKPCGKYTKIALVTDQVKGIPGEWSDYILYDTEGEDQSVMFILQEEDGTVSWYETIDVNLDRTCPKAGLAIGDKIWTKDSEPAELPYVIKTDEETITIMAEADDNIDITGVYYLVVRRGEQPENKEWSILSGDLLEVEAEDGITVYLKVTDKAGLESVVKTDVLEFYTSADKEAEDRAAAGRVEELIGAIGPVTLDSKEAIDTARNAYNGLTDEQKDMVANYPVLERAEREFEDLADGPSNPTKEEPSVDDSDPAASDPDPSPTMTDTDGTVEPSQGASAETGDIDPALYLWLLITAAVIIGTTISAGNKRESK